MKLKHLFIMMAISIATLVACKGLDPRPAFPPSEEALALKAFREALDGNPKFWEIVRDTAGQKPVEKVMVAEVEQSTLDDIEELVAESKKSK